MEYIKKIEIKSSKLYLKKLFIYLTTCVTTHFLFSIHNIKYFTYTSINHFNRIYHH